MDSRHRRRPSSDRFLTTFSISPPSTDAGDELSEDDVFFAASNFNNSPSTSSTPPLSIHHRHHQKSFNPESFGILAALPESSDDRRSVFNHKPLFSPPPPPASSSRMIPRPSVERQRPAKYHQSAPMNVPLLKLKEARYHEFGFEDDNDGVEDDGEMLPPHEIVARQMANSPVLSCSVLEGAGRTLKGRDLRQVRNAVFRHTGFID